MTDAQDVFIPVLRLNYVLRMHVLSPASLCIIPSVVLHVNAVKTSNLLTQNF